MAGVKWQCKADGIREAQRPVGIEFGAQAEYGTIGGYENIKGNITNWGLGTFVNYRIHSHWSIILRGHVYWNIAKNLRGHWVDSQVVPQRFRVLGGRAGLQYRFINAQSKKN